MVRKILKKQLIYFILDFIVSYVGVNWIKRALLNKTSFYDFRRKMTESFMIIPVEW